MNREEIIKLAQEAEFPAANYPSLVSDNDWKALECFAALVAAAERNRTWTQEHWTDYERSIAAAAKAEEREACAKVCEELSERFHAHAADCAAAIRARGETK